MDKYYSLEKICYKVIYRIVKPWFRKWYLKVCTPYIKLKNKLFFNNYSQHHQIDGDIDIVKCKKICVFSHFDRKHEIADYVIFYLQSLQKLDCAIIFVSTSKLEQKSINRIKPLVSKILIRKNIGWDFGSFYTGYQIAKKYNHHELLIFANDSVYGPLHPLQNLTDLMKDCDVGGVTDSYECGYHLQSYFLMFSKRVYADIAFENFFESFIFSNNKTFVVHNYEIRLSRILLKNNFKCKVLCNYLEVANKFFTQTFQYYPEKINREWLEFCNPTHVFWNILIEDFKCPFIKRDFLQANPAAIKNFFSWIETIRKTGYNINLIEENLKQVSTGIFKT